MSGKIYLVNKDGALSPMEERNYDSEDPLQSLLETTRTCSQATRLAASHRDAGS